MCCSSPSGLHFFILKLNLYGEEERGEGGQYCKEATILLISLHAFPKRREKKKDAFNN